MEAVKYAAEHKLKVTVRSGGHSWAAWAVQPGCLLVDLSKIAFIEVDASERLVTASTCTTGCKLNEELLRHGLMFGGGHCPDVAIGGFLLQGGQGWGCRTWGWACEQIECMRVVTAQGDVVNASRTENADLFWAARGCGPGFFGVVLNFTLRLRQKLNLYASTYIFDVEQCYDTIAPWYLERCQSTTKGDLELVMLGFNSAKCLPELQPVRPVMVIRAVVFTKDEDEGRRALQGFNAGIPMQRSEYCRVASDFEATTIAAEYAQQARDNPPGHYWTQNSWLDGDIQQVAAALKKAWTDLPTNETFSLHYSMGPLRPLPTDMCFDIQTEHTFSVYTIAPPNSSLETKMKCNKYIRAVFHNGVDKIPQGQGGTAGIYLGDSDLRDRPIRFMSDENWRKWKDVREHWDPERLFFGYDGEQEHGERFNKNPLE